MPYLILNDYKTYIQGDYLRQLVQGDDNKRVIEENTSLQAIAQRLTAKYDLNLEFTDTKPYDRTRIYKAWERVTVDYSATGFKAWVTLGGYVVGDLVINNSIGYRCTTINNDATFTPSKWAFLGAQYSIYYAAFPSTCTVNGQANPSTLMQPYAPVFNYKTLYSKDDIVYWKGNTYVAVQDSTVISHGQALQYTYYANIPFNNVFPDDQVNNNDNQFWKDRTAYVVTADTPLTNSAWVLGDNRNQTIKDAMVRITTFKLSPLLAPRNRPESWLEDYRSMLRELNEAAKGMIAMLLPVKQPQNNVRTYSGGFIKNMNNY